MRRSLQTLISLFALVMEPLCFAGADTSCELPRSTLDAEGMDAEPFVRLTKWLREHDRFPVFSILVSRRGKLVYELYTSGIDPEAAHYLMSVTKSVVSALVGVAIDRKLIRGADAPVSELLPRALFASEADRLRFSKVTLKDVLGMAAIDAPDPPRHTDPEALALQRRFFQAPDRVAFVLTRPVLAEPFQYNDETPMLASGVIRQATGKDVFSFAEEALFGPLGFRNEEWMHRDASGNENGGYGLRLRPVDLQKLGILYLQKGRWNGRQLISREWIERSFTPWNRSRTELKTPDYGWYWWAEDYGEHWKAHVAKGWKGQRIAVIPEQEIVVTMTACFEDGSEEPFFQALLRSTIIPSVQKGAVSSKDDELSRLIDEVHRGPLRFGEFIEYRMVPSVAPKSIRKPVVENKLDQRD